MARLIDGDALTNYVTEWYEYDLCHDDADEYSAGRASAEHFVLEKIRELPIIDAIPVAWLRKWPKDLREGAYVRDILRDWQKEQEAR